MHLNFKTMVLTITIIGQSYFLYAEEAPSQSWSLISYLRSRFGVTSLSSDIARHEVPQVYNPRIAVIDFSNTVDLVRLEKLLINIAKDQTIQGVLLTINHKGGGNEVIVIHDLIWRLKRVKPVVGLIRGDAFSAGYWVASAVDYLIAHTASEVGNIGVVREVHRWQPTTIKHGEYEATAKIHLLKAGKYKALGNPWSDDLSEDETIYIQADIDAVYELFKRTVAVNRSLDLAQADDWANGKTFMALKALELKLIDEIGTVFEAESKLVELIQNKNPDCLISNNVEYIFMS
jgi:protease IV